MPRIYWFLVAVAASAAAYAVGFFLVSAIMEFYK